MQHKKHTRKEEDICALLYHVPIYIYLFCINFFLFFNSNVITYGIFFSSFFVRKYIWRICFIHNFFSFNIILFYMFTHVYVWNVCSVDILVLIQSYFFSFSNNTQNNETNTLTRYTNSSLKKSLALKYTYKCRISIHLYHCCYSFLL